MLILRLFTLLCFIGIFSANINIAYALPKIQMPNVILIILDDVSKGDIGIYNETVTYTPHIDAVAEQGITLDRFYSHPVCTPTRFEALTGAYAKRQGLDSAIYIYDDKRGIQPGTRTIASIFSEQGYSTALFGKWHLGREEHHNPIHYGFDHFYGNLSGALDYHTKLVRGEVFDWWSDGTEAEPDGYATYQITDAALSYMKNIDSPFFMVVSYTAPHWAAIPETDAFTKLQLPKGHPLENSTDVKARFAAMLEIADSGIGEIAAAAPENTYIMIISDNGGERNYGSKLWKSRGQKGQLFEGGINVPAVIVGPSLPQGRSALLMSAADITPTLVGLAIGSQAANRNINSFDGVNLANYLQTERGLSRELYISGEYGTARINQRYKIIQLKTEQLIYDLSLDSVEKKPLDDDLCCSHSLYLPQLYNK